MEKKQKRNATESEHNETFWSQVSGASFSGSPEPAVTQII
jgi:hypothetical protein